MRIIQNGSGNRTIIAEKGDCLSQIIGKWFINGKEVNLDEIARKQEDENTYIINIQGSVERMEIGYCKEINVTGNAKRIHTSYGDVKIGGDVDGDVHTNMGCIECGNVGGDAHTNMGSVNYKR